MKPEKVIVRTYILSESWSTRPDDPNTLTRKSTVMNDANRDLLCIPVTQIKMELNNGINYFSTICQYISDLCPILHRCLWLPYRLSLCKNWWCQWTWIIWIQQLWWLWLCCWSKSWSFHHCLCYFCCRRKTLVPHRSRRSLSCYHSNIIFDIEHCIYNGCCQFGQVR